MKDGDVVSLFGKDILLDEHELFFDVGDQLNSSLYLCQLRGPGSIDFLPLCAQLRSAGLWSSQNPKQVEDGQREAYKRELEFLGAIAFRVRRSNVVIARFDHPKYSSNEARWDAWVEFFDASYGRAE